MKIWRWWYHLYRGISLTDGVKQMFFFSREWSLYWLTVFSISWGLCFVMLSNYAFQWKEDVLHMKIPQAISRTTGPNTGLFVLILMYFPCWYQICRQDLIILKLLKLFWKKNLQKLVSFVYLSSAYHAWRRLT